MRGDRHAFTDAGVCARCGHEDTRPPSKPTPAPPEPEPPPSTEPAEDDDPETIDLGAIDAALDAEDAVRAAGQDPDAAAASTPGDDGASQPAAAAPELSTPDPDLPLSARRVLDVYRQHDRGGDGYRMSRDMRKAAGIGAGTFQAAVQILVNHGLLESNGKTGPNLRYRAATAAEPTSEPRVPTPDPPAAEQPPPLPPPATAAGVSAATRRALEAQAASDAAAAAAPELTDRQTSIMRLLGEEARTGRELAKLLVENVHDVGGDIRELMKRDLIRSRGDGRWEPLQRGAG